MNNLWEENEALRIKSGLDPGEPLDMDKYHGQLEKRKQEDRAMNIILLNEVEKLENERLNLKKQIRALAMDKGQRSVVVAWLIFYTLYCGAVEVIHASLKH